MKPAASRSRRAFRWIGLTAASLAIAVPLDAVGLTPPLLLGAMMAAIGFAISGVPLALPSRSYIAGQALVGCLIAGSIRLEVFPTLLAD